MQIHTSSLGSKYSSSLFSYTYETEMLIVNDGNIILMMQMLIIIIMLREKMLVLNVYWCILLIYWIIDIYICTHLVTFVNKYVATHC